MEQTYIGTKIIAAEPMDEFTFSTTCRAAFETVVIDGEGKSRPGYKVRYEDDYVSWSPKETFERAYRLATINEKRMFMDCGGTLERPEKDHLHQVYKPGEEPQDMESDA